uniref:CheR-type methyltransferase domain-containing protein n=1 Tax=Desmonostoc muscorum LEGE 12446 TaxID=1828758 RepID=A0A8J7A5E9_DESMC
MELGTENCEDYGLLFKNSQWLNKSHIGKLRFLSVPCSTREEPYSLAMTLLDLGLLLNQFNIDAVDISTKSLAQAKKVIYSRHSFRGDNLEFKDRY